MRINYDQFELGLKLHFFETLSDLLVNQQGKKVKRNEIVFLNELKTIIGLAELIVK